MFTAATALAAAYLCLLGPGHAWLPIAVGSSAGPLVRIAASVIWTTTVGLALAALGEFTVPRLLAVAALVTAAGFAVRAFGAERPRIPARPRLAQVAGPAIALVSILLYWPPYETHVAGTDSTAYLAGGIQLARSGSLSREDPVAADLSPLLRRMLFQPALGNPGQAPFVRQPGSMNLATRNATVASMNFFPAPMIWAALFADVLGPRYAGGYAALFCGLALWAVWRFTRHRVGDAVALVATAAVGLNVAGYWAGRFALSEPLTWFLLWTGLVVLDGWEDEPSDRDAALAGGLLGAAGLIRLDYTLFVATALAVRSVLAHVLGLRRLPLPFYVGFLAMVALTATEIVITPGGYTLPITNALGGFGYRLAVLRDASLPVLVSAGLAAVAAAGLLAAAAWRFGLRTAVAATGAIAFIAAYTLSTTQSQVRLSYSWIEACLGLPVIAAAAFGAIVLWRERGRGPGNVFFLVLLTLVGSLLLYDPHVQPFMLWGLRRFVPLVIPALVVAAASTCHLVLARSRPLGIVMGTLLALSVVAPARGLWRQELYRGAHQQLAHLHAGLPMDAVLLIDRPLASYMLGTGLWLVHDRECIPVDTTSEKGRSAIVSLAFRLGRGRPVYLLQPAAEPPASLKLVGQEPITTHHFELIFPDQPSVESTIGTREYSMAVSIAKLHPYRGEP
ncbi:MAG: hypothetical protein V3R77_01695 [Candidatus Binatia bacterium]